MIFDQSQNVRKMAAAGFCDTMSGWLSASTAERSAPPSVREPSREGGHCISTESFVIFEFHPEQ